MNTIHSFYTVTQDYYTIQVNPALWYMCLGRSEMLNHCGKKSMLIQYTSSHKMYTNLGCTLQACCHVVHFQLVFVILYEHFCNHTIAHEQMKCAWGISPKSTVVKSQQTKPRFHAHWDALNLRYNKNKQTNKQIIGQTDTRNFTTTQATTIVCTIAEYLKKRFTLSTKYDKPHTYIFIYNIALFNTWIIYISQNHRIKLTGRKHIWL